MEYTTLIDVDDLARKAAAPDWVLFDCRFDLADPARGRADYTAGHIPGAHYAHLDDDLADPATPHSGRHPLPAPARLAAYLGARAVGADSQVVAYDAQGGAIAARLWWLLRWLGHRRVAVLDGGFGAWRAAGQALATGTTETAGGPPCPYRPDPGLALGAAELASSLEAGRVRLLDARAPARFRGEHEPLDPVAGHVPGAVNHAFAGDLARDGHWLPAAALRERLEGDLAGFAASDTVCMCGSGVTACHTLLSLEIAGLPGAKLYPGSWSEWIRDPSRPVATGD